MSLTLVTGPANAAKAGYVLDAYRAELPRRPLLVVPTRADVAHYTRELAGGGAVVGANVTAFGGLLREIARRTGYDGRPLGRLQRERVVQDAVGGAELQTLGPSAAAPGFARAAGELFAELERAFVTPRRFAGALGIWVADATGRDAYAHDVARLYGRYAAALERLDRVDDDLFAWRALDALRAAPGAWGTTAVFLYGFDDLAPAQRDAVTALARVPGAHVTVSLTYEAGRAAFAGRAETFEELRSMADEIVPLEPAADFYAPGSRDALHHLERHLFEEDGRVAEPGGAVRLLEAGGERGEVELVAAEVLMLLRAGVPPGGVAVVVRSPDRTASLIDQVFAAYGIPIAHAHSVPLEHLAIGRALLGLARAALDAEAAPSELLAYLRAPGLLRQPELADRLELTVRRERLHTAGQARAAWEGANPSFPLEALDRIGAAAERDERALLATIGREAGRLFHAPRRGQAPILAAEELPEARAFAELSRALDELDELAATGAVAPYAPMELLDTLAGLEVRLGNATAPGAVLVSDPLGVRARRFRAVFVCGLQEGEFPRLPRPEPFLSDDVRRELREVAGLPLRREGDVRGEERYLFYAATSRAEEQVLLSYRVSDEEGNPALPSFFVDEVKRLFGPALEDERAQRPLAEVAWPPHRAPTEHELARSEAACAPRIQPAPIAPLSSAPARAALRHQAELSAGALEAYADCPVKWLVERELEPQRLEPDPDYFERGSYAHAVLERTLRRMRDEHGSARLTEQSLPPARRVLAQELEAQRGSFGLGPTRATGDAVARRVAADLERYLTHAAASAPAEGAREPAHFELAFGMGEEGERPALELGGGAVRLRGKIDRVDVDRESGTAFVHDYKSGRENRRWHGSNWLEERQLQVALYMLLVERGLGLTPVGGVYQPLSGKDLRGRGLVLDAPEARRQYVRGDLCDEAELQAALAGAEERAVALAEQLRAGELRPSPETCRRDGGCAYPGICRGPGA